MASIIALFAVLIVACICVGHADKEFINVQCKAVNRGQFGQQSLLECVIKTSQEVSDPEILIVTWKKHGAEKPLLVFDRGSHKNSPGYVFAEPHWDKKNMNVSLLITNTAVEHEGEYTCMVITDSGDNEATTNLKVTAQYNDPTVSMSEKNRQGDEGVLVCKSDGGYPKGQLRWFVESTTDWTNGSEMSDERENGSLYRLSSKLRLMRGSTFSKYTCVVFNASGGKEGEATFVVSDAQTGPENQENPSKIVAPVVVIGSLLVGLLLLLFIRRRSRQARRQSQVPFLDDHEAVPTHSVDQDTCDVEKGAQ